MIAFLGWALVAATFVVLIGEIIYFRRQQMVCEKYPFYSLRDEVIWQLANDEDKKTLLPIYEQFNSLVNALRKYNFHFHTKVFASYLRAILEEAHKCGFDSTKDWTPKPKVLLHPLQKQFLKLLVKTARNNSILLRLAMTRPGMHVLLTATLPVVVLKFVSQHPELHAKLQAPKDYAQAQTLLARAA